jgi:hypothetical protein
VSWGVFVVVVVVVVVLVVCVCVSVSLLGKALFICLFIYYHPSSLKFEKLFKSQKQLWKMTLC